MKIDMVPQSLHRARELRFVSENFFALQGLYAVPLALGIIGHEIAIPALSTHPSVWQWLWAAAIVPAFLAVGSYYRWRFGWLRRCPDDQIKDATMAFSLVAIAFFAYVFVVLLGSRLELPMATRAIAFAIWFLALGQFEIPKGLKVFARMVGSLQVALAPLPIIPALRDHALWGRQGLAPCLVAIVGVLLFGALAHHLLHRHLRSATTKQGW